MLSLPRRWVFVWFVDGTMESAANTDTLDADEAQQFRDEWEKARGKKVIRVDLQSSTGDLIKSYNY